MNPSSPSSQLQSDYLTTMGIDSQVKEEQTAFASEEQRTLRKAASLKNLREQQQLQQGDSYLNSMGIDGEVRAKNSEFVASKDERVSRSAEASADSGTRELNRTGSNLSQRNGPSISPKSGGKKVQASKPNSREEYLSEFGIDEVTSPVVG